MEAIKTFPFDADEQGVMVLCVHVDADAPNDENAFKNKLDPAFKIIEKLEEEKCCKNLIAVVPVYMTEAWMLSDIELLKQEIGTQKRNADLGLNRNPESINDPKQAIEEAIRISRQELARRRRKKLSISDLYSPLGQKISIESLKRINSYQKFCNAVMESFIKLGYRD